MTMSEMLEEEFKPDRQHNTVRGQTFYYCPVCGWLVGTYSDGTVHKEVGLIYKRDVCKFGHNVDWSDYE